MSLVVVAILAMARSDQPEHVVSHATFHGTWFAVFVFYSGSTSFSRHSFHSLSELSIGLGNRFHLIRALELAGGFRRGFVRIGFGLVFGIIWSKTCSFF